MIQVALVVFPGVQALDVSGPMDVFAEANRFLMPEDRYYLTVVGTTASLITCSNGLPIAAHTSYQQLFQPAFDLVLVAGGPSLPEQAPDPALSQWLVHAAANARRFGSICNGTFLLGHAGLLDGRTVATHWGDAEALARTFPLAKVDPDRIHVKDEALYTSAGVTAGIDLALFLVKEDHGPEVALNVARRLVVFMQRSGGQSQFSPYLTPYAEETSPVATCQQHVLKNIDKDLSVEMLAAAVAMSPRHFARVFTRDTGMTPAEFVARARVDAARARLEQSDAPLKTIAFECGFGTASKMRSAFLRFLGVTAQQYRDNFQVARAPAP